MFLGRYCNPQSIDSIHQYNYPSEIVDKITQYEAWCRSILKTDVTKYNQINSSFAQQHYDRSADKQPLGYSTNKASI